MGFSQNVSKLTQRCPLWVLAFVCLLQYTVIPTAHANPKTHPLIIAVGDLHADLSSAQKTFQIAGVTDAEGKWILSNAVVVQTGDLTDRGPDGEPLLEWIRSLETQAPQFGSQLIVVLGNHEVMNLQGDWRYVSPQDVQSFGGLEQRKKAFSLQQQGKWASWLIGKDAVVQVGDTIFVHGGVSEDFMFTPVELSRRVQMAILGQGDPAILSENGPLWYRGYWREAEEQACIEAEKVLHTLGAKRMVMGHTTQRDGQIHARCNETLFAIDTGISTHYGEHPAALRIEGERVLAVYPTGVVALTGTTPNSSK